MGMTTSPNARKSLLVVLLGSLYAVPATAEISDTIHPFVAAMVQHDDNLLLRDTSLDPNSVYSDTYKTLQVGFLLERPIGRQMLTGTFSTSRVNFDRFSELDYTGKNGKLDLGWVIGNRLKGHIGATYSESLASFSDFHSTELNLRTDKSVYGSGAWQFHPDWQVNGGYKRQIYHFDLASQSYNNRTETTTDVGVDYLVKSGSSVGLLLRRIEGDYSRVYFGNGAFNDSSYAHNELDLNLSWVFSAITQVTFLGGWARRTYDVGASRDSSGGHGRLIANWAPLSHVQFGASVWREFSAVEGVVINGAMLTGQSVNATWSPTAKIAVSARLQNEKRDFLPLGGASNLGDLTDRTRTASLAVDYAVMRQVTLGLNASRNMRDGSSGVQTNSYRNNSVGFSASVKF